MGGFLLFALGLGYLGLGHLSLDEGNLAGVENVWAQNRHRNDLFLLTFLVPGIFFARLALYLGVQLAEAIDQGLRGGRAAGHIDINRDKLVHSGHHIVPLIAST
jgi:hypothetical protein